MKFAELAGQRVVINKVIDIVNQNRLSHNYMIIGPDGCGTLAFAIAMAQYVNCTNKQLFSDNNELKGDSCGVCASCLKNEKLIHPDLHFFFPLSKEKKVSHQTKYSEWRSFLFKYSFYVDSNQWYEFYDAKKQFYISADDCNELLNILNYNTYEGEYKIVIIWLVEKLFHAAAPKLLKILEEPQDKTLFLLVSEEPHLVLNTIASRSQFIKLKKLSRDDIVEHLKKTKNINENQATMLANKHSNNLSKIYIELQNEVQDYDFESFLTWMRNCYTQKITNIIKDIEKLQELNKEEQKEFLNYALQQIRNSLAYKYNQDIIARRHNSQEIDFYKKFCTLLNNHNVEQIYNEINQAIYYIERNANTKINFTVLSLKIGSLLKN